MTYLKLFSIGFAILFFIHLILYNYKPNVMFESLIYGFFGGISFIIIGLTNFIAGKAIGIKSGETLKTLYEHEEIKKASVYAIKNHLKNFYAERKTKIYAEKDDMIMFKTPISFKTLGTLIEYRFQTQPEGTLIKVITRPILKTIIIDYGASYQEIKLAKEVLSKI